MTRHVNLISDTVTQPTAAMREAMAQAVVGDDGFGEDPTVNALEAKFARLVGKDAAVFVPSGVMANQIALRIHTRPGDVVVAGRGHHVVSFEMGAAARNSSIQFATVDDTSGVMALPEVLDAIEAEQSHQPHVALVSAENTHMPSGGTPIEIGDLTSLASAIGDRPLHLDGARLFNAVVATGTSAAQFAAAATTVMCSLTKGLCAPVGSLLAGPSELMQRARVERKRLGGTMHQSGFLAAAGIVALDTMTERLVEDHVRARRLAEMMSVAFPESGYDPSTCRTNIVVFTHPQARQITSELSALGVLGDTIGPRRARFVTHADITDDDLDFVDDVLARFRPATR